MSTVREVVVYHMFAVDYRCQEKKSWNVHGKNIPKDSWQNPRDQKLFQKVKWALTQLNLKPMSKPRKQSTFKMDSTSACMLSNLLREGRSDT